MDPNANRKELLELALKLVTDNHLYPDATWSAQRLAELVLALDGWLKSGGFLPDVWRR